MAWIRVLALVLLCAGERGFAAPARVDDSLAQRLAACAVCHGDQGRAAPDGYHPRIAGKPAAYLFHQLLNFRDGRRRYGPMARLVAPLSDAYLWEIAQYFAALDLPHAAPVPTVAAGAALARGRQLALQGDAARGLPACAACHGAALTGALPATPGLLGLPRAYLTGQLGAWVAGLRNAQAPDCMADIARRLGGDDIAAVSAWLASQAMPADPRALARLPAPAPMRCGSAVGVAR